MSKMRNAVQPADYRTARGGEPMTSASKGSDGRAEARRGEATVHTVIG